MNVYRADPIEVRQGRAHWARVRGLEAPKVKPKEVRAASRDAIGAEIDGALVEIRHGYEIERGQQRFAESVRHRDAVRTMSLPKRQAAGFVRR